MIKPIVERDVAQQWNRDGDEHLKMMKKIDNDSVGERCPIMESGPVTHHDLYRSHCLSST